MPADFFSQLRAIADNIGTLNLYALGLRLTCLVGLLIWPRLFDTQSRYARAFSSRPVRLIQAGEGLQLRRAPRMASRLPDPIVALLTLKALAYFLHLPVETIGTRLEASFRLYGSLFFGAVAKIDPILNVVESAPQGLVVRLDVQSLQSLDASGLDVLEQLHKSVTMRGGRLVLAGLNAQPKVVMERSGFLAKVESL